ncbi:hypothetical protein ACFWBB_07270 [Streptomyces sp. NPDC060000]|uniref:hypothetical protein n=1 Tax=Streptomyces sp. NPDC060000 TaxID=3347031 RepID=UPI0036B91703
MPPTVLGDVTSGTAIWRQEVSGPVLVRRAVDGFAAAVQTVDESGTAYQEQGEEALRLSTRVKTVAVHFGG